MYSPKSEIDNRFRPLYYFTEYFRTALPGEYRLYRKDYKWITISIISVYIYICLSLFILLIYQSIYLPIYLFLDIYLYYNHLYYLFIIFTLNR